MAAPEVEGIRGTNSDPLLGLKFPPAAAVDPDGEATRLLDFLRECVAETAAGFDAARPADDLGLPDLDGGPVAWTRRRFTLYPLYVERLTVAPTPEGTAPEPLRRGAPGEFLVDPESLRAGGPRHWASEANRDGFRAAVAAMVADGGCRGGFAYNALTIPAEALRSGAIDLRPASLHALTDDGAACDRRRPAAQAAVANAFWQTFWATGALRSQRGEVFPVAFLPIDRSHALEFAPPYTERFISLRRRLFGRTAILAFAIEALTKAKALLFDLDALRFRVAPGFDAATAGVPARDVMLAIRELDRTGWPDSATGANATLFAPWREREATGPAPEPSPYREGGDQADPPKVRGGGKGGDFLEGLRPDPATPADRLVRIHRVVPYAGCAYLREVMHDRAGLEATGKLRSLDAADRIVAATNSTFFLNFPEEYATLHSALNEPVSLLVEDGRMLHLKTLRRAAFVLSTDGRAAITTRAGIRLTSDVLVFEGEGASANFFEKSDRPFSANQYGPLFFGAVVVGDSMVETFEEIRTEIPANGWITGDSEAFGGRIEPRGVVEVQVREPGGGGEMPVRHAFAVGPLLVEAGRPVPFGESREEFAPIRPGGAPSAAVTSELSRTELPPELMEAAQRGVPPMRFPHDWDLTRAPRTALGVKPDGTVMLVVVDGRADLDHSVGATLAELARLMINLGCESAMNLDGGGSSVMFVADPRARGARLRDDLAEGVVNLPSDMGGVERLLPVPLLVVNRKP